ncbi:hypothetical protein PV326_012109 [Microctonus aethiopoides]|nr:hypothetical protein PV326_012109 [Microctonus aethiopoides]
MGATKSLARRSRRVVLSSNRSRTPINLKRLTDITLQSQNSAFKLLPLAASECTVRDYLECRPRASGTSRLHLNFSLP